MIREIFEKECPVCGILVEPYTICTGTVNGKVVNEVRFYACPMTEGIEICGHRWKEEFIEGEEIIGASKIDYLDWVINPISGCTVASDGCANCYARTMYNKFDKSGLPFETVRMDLPRVYKELNTIDGKEPMVVGVNFMGDTFHEVISYSDILRMMASFASFEEHQFMILTKRFKRLVEFINMYRSKIPGNVHFGISVCNNKDLYKAIGELQLLEKNYKLIISFEPLLERLEPHKLHELIKINAQWCIVGSESNGSHGGRPFEEEWAFDILGSCNAFTVPFYFKQQFVKNKKTNILEGATYLDHPLKEMLKNEK